MGAGTGKNRRTQSQQKLKLGTYRSAGEAINDLVAGGTHGFTREYLDKLSSAQVRGDIYGAWHAITEALDTGKIKECYQVICPEDGRVLVRLDSKEGAEAMVRDCVTLPCNYCSEGEHVVEPRLCRPVYVASGPATTQRVLTLEGLKPVSF